METIATGKRITLCKPTLELCDQVLEAVVESKAELAKYLPWVEFALTEQSTKDNMLEAIENYENFREELRIAIIERSTGRFLGMTGLIICDKSIPHFEIGYWLRTSEVGKGYIAEAVRLVESYAFKELDAQRVQIRAVKSNTKSIAVAKRCGFVFEAQLKHTRRLPDGELDDTIVYRKLIHEYREQNESNSDR